MGPRQLPADAHPRPPRRLSRQARHDQIVAATMPLLARRGPLDLSLDEVAARVDVTRNLLYHYFPGGRSDLVAAAVQEAERQLLGPLADGPASTADLAQLQAALSRVLDHALTPTHAWRIHRMARFAVSPSVSTIIAGTGRTVVEVLLAFRGNVPSPALRVALQGYLAFAETVLDEARTAGIARANVKRLLGRTLESVLGDG